MSILIQRPGILSTVQDLGRAGYRALGISPGGAMDRTAVRLLNTLLGNPEGDAVLEMHFPAAEILFERHLAFAVGGADLSPELDGRAISNWRVYHAETGSSLRFSGKVSGNRSYLAIGGGLETSKWLGSSSTNLTVRCGGINGRKIAVGERIGAGDAEEYALAGAVISPSLVPKYSSFPTVRTTRGAEFDLMLNASKESFETSVFLVSNESNRMGFRLAGGPLGLSSQVEILSSAVCFGTVQLLPDGQVIVLMADHQTTGGYPRIAHVIEHDLPVLAQLGAGDKVAFHLISNEESELINSRFEREMAMLRVGCRLRKLGQRRQP